MKLSSRIARISGLLLILTAKFAVAEPLTTGWENVAGVDIFYREGGDTSASTIVFLHGNPASSLQYVRLMEALAQRYHVLAMDYPSFGFSASPDRAEYAYTFDHVAATVRDFLRARRVAQYALFMQDYGVPIGFRLISEAPEAITALVIQNGVIHLDGFPAALDENGELRRHWKSRDHAIDERRRAYTENANYPQRAGWQWPARSRLNLYWPALLPHDDRASCCAQRSMVRLPDQSAELSRMAGTVKTDRCTSARDMGRSRYVLHDSGGACLSARSAAR